MLYIFNRNNRVHISWNATEKRNAPSGNAKSGIGSALSLHLDPFGRLIYG